MDSLAVAQSQQLWAHTLSCFAGGILVPWPGIKPASLALQHGVLTTGPPGKSPVFILNFTHTSGILVSQVALTVKNPPANPGEVRDSGSVPGLGRYPGERNGNALQCSCLENPMDRGAWWATVHGVTKSKTRLITVVSYFKILIGKLKRGG